MDALSGAVVLLNDWGRACCNFAGRMFLQSGILVGLLLIADLCLRTRVSARFRYGLWLLVLVKLVLPPSLALPTGVGYWLGGYLPVASVWPESSASVGLVTPEHAGFFAEIDVTPPATAEVAHVSRTVSLQWPGLMLLGWIVGVLLLLMLVLWRIASVRRSLARSRPAGPQMVGLLQECRAELGIAVQVGLRLTDDVHSPAVCGFRRPVILLPAVLPSRLWPQGLRTIFTHELTHIQRRDPWVNLAQTALQVIYFWHPLVWAANAVLRYLRELAVDETVLVKLRSQAQCYTDTLIDVAEMAFRKPAFSLRLIGIAESKRVLERRITHMLSQHTSKRPALGRAGLLVILVIGAVLVPMGQGGMAAPAAQNAVQSAPALPPGIAELFGLSKDDILAKFGAPGQIFRGDQTYTLDNLPDEYFLAYDDLSFAVGEGVVVGVTLLSPTYAFGNGIRVGDSEEKVKQAFGPPSQMEETEFKDFLNYDSMGLSFEIHKEKRSVMEINIDTDYGDPARLQAIALAPEFMAQLPARIAQLDIDSAGLERVLAIFGQPTKYGWGMKTLPADRLPERFIVVYPGGFHVFMMDNRIVEIRHEDGSTYVHPSGLRIGLTLDEALAIVGPPVKTVVGEEIDWKNSANVLFKDIGGRKGHDYYHRPDRKMRLWFGNDKVIAIYMTRSDYGKDDSEPFDPEFARLLTERVAALNIDSAGPEQVKAIFGEPLKYVWSNKTFAPDALPEGNYIMVYPCSFCVWLQKGRIMEIRHERGSPYAYAGTLRIGSTLQEALDLLGPPDETVTGLGNAFKDRVLYKDIDGDRGHDYYHRADQKVRIWFAGDKIIAIYMTRSDFPVAR